MTSTIRLKRVYEKPAAGDGFRILVDRLWPRGVAKAEAHIDAWLKSTAPSTELRQWFGHDPAKWDEFRRRYTAELKQHPDAVAELRALVAGKKNVTFVFSERDTEHTHAIVLKEFISRGAHKPAPAKKAARTVAKQADAKKPKKRPRPAPRKAARRRSR
jgi:uncharacterized protein YeaO (DUF488 family)